MDKDNDFLTTCLNSRDILINDFAIAVSDKQEFSFFKHTIRNTIPNKNVTIKEVYELIKSNSYSKITQQFRLLVKGSAEAKAFKANNFNYACFSGVFTNRSNNCLVQHSSLIVIDFDGLNDVTRVKSLLIKDKVFVTELLFISPSGDGLKWVVSIDLDIQNHLEWFKQISLYIKRTYDLEVDASGKDVSRACFLPFDPEVYINPHHLRKALTSTVFDDGITNKVEDAISNIESHRIDITEGYNNWRDVGFAFAHEFGESGRDYFHRVSRCSSQYNFEKCNEQYNRCLKSNGSGVTIASFLWRVYKTCDFRASNYVHTKTPSIDKAYTPICHESFDDVDFPIEVFPEVVQQFVTQSAEAINCPVDFICLSILTSFAMAIGSGSVVSVKNDWQEPPVLFSAIVGDPGAKKTPSLKMGTLPIRLFQKELISIFRNQKEKYDSDVKAYNQAVEKYNQLSGIEKISNTLPDKPKYPVMGQIKTSDSTIEALSSLLLRQPSGILFEQDELAAWVKSMNQYKSKGSDLEKWLSFWSCSDIIINRKTDEEPIALERPFVCVLGCIQPDVIEDLSKKDNGFVDRILFVVPKPIKSVLTDSEVHESVKTKIIDAFNKVFEYVDYEDKLNSDLPRKVKMSTEAYNHFSDFMNNTHYPEMDSIDLPYYLKGVWSKFSGYTARFALIIQAMKYGTNSGAFEKVDIESIKSAIRLTEYFKIQARLVQDILRITVIDKQIERLVKILRKEGGTISIRDIYYRKIGGIQNRKQAISVVKEMEDRGLGSIIEITPEKGGRKTELFKLK